MNYSLWQLIDSGFPSGGFAHSAGLEAAVHYGLVEDAAALTSFARQAAWQAGRTALPIATAAYRDPASLPDLDRLSDTFIINDVAKRASRVQGRALLTSASRSFPRAGLGEFEALVKAAPLCGHYAPLFGLVLAALGIELVDTQRLFLFLAGRSVASAAVRLGLIGAYDAQELQTTASGDLDAIVAACGNLEPQNISQTSPLIDLCQSTHDRLYSRLFQS
jgi:urease accessory protein